MAENFSIGKTIATLRKAKGWTQVELAEKLNVSDKAVSKWESEAGFPEISQFPALAKVFGVTIDYLMTGAEMAKKVVTMSKAELCAKTDDITLIGEIDPTHKDENKKTFIDYIVQYDSYEVFIAFCEKDKHNISKFSFLSALKYCIILNRLDLLRGASFSFGSRYRFDFKNESEILSLLVKEDEKYFQNDYNAKAACILTEDIIKTIVCDERINESTFSVLFGNQGNRQCIWYHVFPFLIHQAYINDKKQMLDRLLRLSAESNDRGFEKYIISTNRWGERNLHSNYFFLTDGYNGHGFVRILEETIKNALDKGDFSYVDKFNTLNSTLNEYYSFKAYVASPDVIRVAKLKLDKTVSKKEFATQAALHEGILNIDELLTINDYNVIKSALDKYPIHIVEHLQNLYEAKNYRAIFEWTVDNNSDELQRAILRFDDNEIMRNILRFMTQTGSKYNCNAKHIKMSYSFTSKLQSEYDSQKKFQELWDEVKQFFKQCKQTVLGNLKNKLDKATMIAGLTKEYFEQELAKGNIEIVIIKLCVRLEAILRADYHYEGTFEEMLSKYCSSFNTYDDEDNNYDPYTPQLLHKLRMQRNSIVHSERNGASMNVDEIKQCINYICKLG